MSVGLVDPLKLVRARLGQRVASPPGSAAGSVPQYKPAHYSRHPSLPALPVTGVKSCFAEALRDQYALQREIGRGGRATVCLAQNFRHDRPVALEVLYPSSLPSSAPSPSRARSAPQLSSRTRTSSRCSPRGKSQGGSGIRCPTSRRESARAAPARGPPADLRRRFGRATQMCFFGQMSAASCVLVLTQPAHA
jgi:serine/threonine protein kinase